MSEGFVVEQHVEGNVSVLRFKGGCDRAGLRALKELLEQFVGEVDAALVVDLGEAGFVDSSGVAYLLKTRRALENDGKRFVLASVPALVRRTFVTLGVDGLFRFANDEAEAIASVSAG